MNCPNCGTPEKARIKICPECEQAYASQDLLEMRQLEFLLEETDAWQVADSLRSAYKKRLDLLIHRLQLQPKDSGAIPPEPDVAPTPAVAKPKPAPPEPPKEKVPFDQWLLSERNIKIALYSGGLLLLIAGIIFIGVNWTRIPGPGKFAITLMITGLMYLGGYLLIQRPAYRIGGVALLGIASGFFVLNFAVLQIYVMGPRGMADNVMWLIASPFCLLLYMLTAYWTKSDLFTYFSLFALGSTLTAALVLAGASELIFLLTFSLLAVVLYILAQGLISTQLAEFTSQPLTIVAHILMPITYLATFIYLLEPYGTGNPWLTLPILGIGAVFYVLIAFRSRRLIFSYASLVAIAGFGFATLFLLDVPVMVYPLAYAIFAYACLILARLLKDTTFGDFIRFPLLSSSQIVMPLMIFLVVLGWIFQDSIQENPWLGLITLGIGVLFYISTDVLFKHLEARWAAALLFPVTLGLTMYELNLSFSAIGITFMVLAILYLGFGYALQNREDRKAGGWPLYATAYVLSALVTILALPSTDDLVMILFADVVILVISALIHRVYWWEYGAVWLFMVPVYLTINLYVSELHYQGLLMGLLGLNYAAAGYFLGRRKLDLGAPFLTAAAFLSVVTIGLTWTNPITATLVMTASAVLYFLAGFWLGWSWLLFPGLVLLNLIVLNINLIFFNNKPPIELALLISYTLLGVVFTLGGLVLRRTKQDRWSWPLYIVGAIDIGCSYIISLAFAGWLTIGISTILALVLFSFAWLERKLITKLVKIPLLTYLGIGVLFIGQFYLLLLTVGGGSWDNVWPAYSAGLCAVFVALAWLLKRDPLETIYSIPLRWSGLCLMVIPLIGSLAIFIVSLVNEPNPVIVVVTFCIAGATFAGDAVKRRSIREFYLGLGSLMIVFWAVLYALEIYEPQAYIIPIGLSLLGIGWYERSSEGNLPYKILTYAGLMLLMGTAFIQSIPRGAYAYAILLGFESLLAIGWGMRSHCRCYVQVGGLALIANAIVQLGPGFVYLPRWIQIGLTGAILLGGGMAALFRREQILNTRQRLSDEWRQWNP